MFRRKDEAYDTNDLLQDVMSGIEDDELIESPSKAPAKTETKPLESIVTEQDNIKPQAAPAAAQPAPQPAAPVAPSAQKPATPAAAFRPQASAPRNVAAAAAAASNVPSAPAAMNNNAAKSGKRVLTVGHDIHMKGEISTCDRLVIEGSVDASLNDVHTVEISQSGSFKGSAEIEDAEISGTFDGDLIVNGRLTIYATGKVNGNVAYGEIEIERGGKLTGTLKTAEQAKAERSKPAMKKAA